MDGIFLALFLFAAFVGGFASGLAGFAMGFVVSGIWLHILTPVQTTALIVGYGLLTQGYGVWKLRHALAWKNIAPFIVGGTIGIPIGTVLLTYANPAYLRNGVGLLLMIYGAYGLTQPTLKVVSASVSADVGIGFVNGILAGLTGLPGFIITVLSISRVEERLSTRGVSAGNPRGYGHECHIAGDLGRHYGRDFSIVLDWSPGNGCRSLVWVQALWKAGRCNVS
jgi:uncharacterized membrane protein YfcA